jgi:hypothetical protein
MFLIRLLGKEINQRLLASQETTKWKLSEIFPIEILEQYSNGDGTGDFGLY